MTTTTPAAREGASQHDGRLDPARLGWAAAGLAGLLTGAAAIGVAEALATLWQRTGLGHGVPSPVLAVGGTFVDHTPGWLKDFAITHFGRHDKQVLLGGIGLTLVLLSVVAGLVARRRIAAGLALVGVLGLVAGYAALTRPNSWPVDVVPTVIGIGAGGFVLRALVVSYGGGSGRDWSRRTFLIAAGATGAVAIVAGGGSRLLQIGSAGVAASRKAVRLPAPAEPLGAIPGGVTLPVKGISPYRTSNRSFYRVDTALALPELRAEDWRLKVHGMIGKELELDFQDLLAKPLVERAVTLTCVSNEVGGKLMGNAVWLGYPLKDLLAQANPDEDADMVLSTSVDGMTIGTPLAELMDGRDALLAVAMNGEPLPVAHGFPVRMIVPGLYGYVSATKWVVDLKVTRFDQDKAYWTPRGYSERAPIKTSSRIDVPGSFANLERGKVAVAGVAWAQTRGISKVEARVDGGAWQEARLADSLSKQTWRQWVWEWDATPGSHTLECRATDGTGDVQTSALHGIRPDGTTGLDSVVVKVA
ncbi:MAG: molybdopterin-dependent oxidoreductase [Actinomycetota bacterium]|nr:molybdopterin-dependent oxidoreductase [Actinomycetota bacterium]